MKRCRADLHRFLRALREDLGEYLWVREFQARGVVHYHVLAEEEISQERAAEAWARASGQFDDEAVLRHGVKVDSIRSQGGAKRYLGQYIGKERQKELPKGVDGAGRWWGRSRGLKLAVLEDIVWLDLNDMVPRKPQLRIVRILRRFIEKRFRRRYRGGAFIDFGGVLSATLARLAEQLRKYYGWDPTLEEQLETHGWDQVTEEGSSEHVGGDQPPGCETGVEEAEGEAGGDDRGADQEELFEAS